MLETPRCSICDAPLDTADGETCAECLELLRWFRSYFADLPKLDLLTINPRTRFVEDLGLDSLDYIDWVLEAELIFGINISNRDAERMHTVGDYLARLHHDGARWLSNQDIEIVKKRLLGRNWKVVSRVDPKQ